MKFTKTFEEYAKEIYAWNKEVGWWDEGDDRCLHTCLQLISTEVAEATEGYRKTLMDDHLPDYPMEAVELADTLIRTLDLVGYWLETIPNFKLSEYMAYHAYCIESSSTGKQHLGINVTIVRVAGAYDNYSYRTDGSKLKLAESLSGLITSITKVADNKRYPLEEIMLAKMKYNRTRLDHKRENRNKNNGKII